MISQAEFRQLFNYPAIQKWERPTDDIRLFIYNYIVQFWNEWDRANSYALDDWFDDLNYSLNLEFKTSNVDYRPLYIWRAVLSPNRAYFARLLSDSEYQALQPYLRIRQMRIDAFSRSPLARVFNISDDTLNQQVGVGIQAGLVVLGGAIAATAVPAIGVSATVPNVTLPKLGSVVALGGSELLKQVQSEAEKQLGEAISNIGSEPATNDPVKLVAQVEPVTVKEKNSQLAVLGLPVLALVLLLI